MASPRLKPSQRLMRSQRFLSRSLPWLTVGLTVAVAVRVPVPLPVESPQVPSRPAASWSVASRPVAAWPVVSPAGAGAPAPVAGGFRWPIEGAPRPVRRFDPPPRPWLPGHRGVDLAAEPGAVVRAAGAGLVLFAGWIAGRPVISVSHAAGLRTTYEPVLPEVRAGDQVTAGAPIGELLAGHPGCRTEPAGGSACLHWGLRRGEEYLDPLALLGLGRVRLLPVSAPAPAGRAVLSRGGRTPRRGCRPARRAAASPGRPRR